MSVTLQRLRYFVAVAEELSFTRAAARLYVSQPALSEQVQRLERDLGLALLRRSTRSVELTEAGRTYLDEVRPLLAGLERARERALAVQEAAAATVRIAYTASVAYQALPLLLDELAQDRPDIEALPRQLPSEAALQAVLLDDADVALVRELDGAPGLTVETVRREPLAAFMSDRHALADREAISVDDLRGRTVLVVARDLAPGFSGLVGRLCAVRGFQPELVPLTDLRDREPLLALLARTPDRLFVGPVSMGNVAWEGVRGVPVSDPDARIRLTIAVREGERSDSVAAVLRAARRVASRAGWDAETPPGRADQSP